MTENKQLRVVYALIVNGHYNGLFSTPENLIDFSEFHKLDKDRNREQWWIYDPSEILNTVFIVLSNDDSLLFVSSTLAATQEYFQNKSNPKTSSIYRETLNTPSRVLITASDMAEAMAAITHDQYTDEENEYFAQYPQIVPQYSYAQQQPQLQQQLYPDWSQYLNYPGYSYNTDSQSYEY